MKSGEDGSATSPQSEVHVVISAETFGGETLYVLRAVTTDERLADFACRDSDYFYATVKLDETCAIDLGGSEFLIRPRG